MWPSSQDLLIKYNLKLVCCMGQQVRLADNIQRYNRLLCGKVYMTAMRYCDRCLTHQTNAGENSWFLAKADALIWSSALVQIVHCVPFCCSDFPNHASVWPYFSTSIVMPRPSIGGSPSPDDGIHLIICVHGLDGKVRHSIILTFGLSSLVEK